MKSTKEKIHILKEEIRMIKSHQNISNWQLCENMINNRLKQIKKLNKKCEFCSEPCKNKECFAKE